LHCSFFHSLCLQSVNSYPCQDIIKTSSFSNNISGLEVGIYEPATNWRQGHHGFVQDIWSNFSIDCSCNAEPCNLFTYSVKILASPWQDIIKISSVSSAEVSRFEGVIFYLVTIWPRGNLCVV
jgi:hypothetical protein